MRERRGAIEWWARQYSAIFCVIQCSVEWWCSGHRSEWNDDIVCANVCKLCRLHLHMIRTQFEPDYLQTWSDHSLIITCLHLALTSGFPYLDNLYGYRSHSNNRCKWNADLSPFSSLFLFCNPCLTPYLHYNEAKVWCAVSQENTHSLSLNLFTFLHAETKLTIIWTYWSY